MANGKAQNSEPEVNLEADEAPAPAKSASVQASEIAAQTGENVRVEGDTVEVMHQSTNDDPILEGRIGRPARTDSILSPQSDMDPGAVDAGPGEQPEIPRNY